MMEMNIQPVVWLQDVIVSESLAIRTSSILYAAIQCIEERRQHKDILNVRSLHAL